MTPPSEKQRGHQHLHLFLFLLLILLSPIHSRQSGALEPKDPSNTLLPFSSTWPLTTILNNYPAAIQATSTIITHLTTLESTLFSTLPRTSFDPTPQTKTTDLTPCNFGRRCYQWILWARFTVETRGYPRPSFACITQHIPSHPTPDLHTALDVRASLLSTLAPRIIQAANLNWSNPSAVHRSPYETRTRLCTINYAAAIRVNTTWHVASSITNAPPDHQLPSPTRQYLTEFSRFPSQSFASFYLGPNNMSLPNTTLHNLTTTLRTSRGHAPPSFFGATVVSTNPAVVHALGQSQVYTEQAEDAMTPSNIAILFLPLLLNLVPISLVADVRSRSVLLYAIFGHILAILPLAIKGFELVFDSGSDVRATATRISSVNSGQRSQSAVAEIWTAQCIARSSIMSTGWVFIAVSILFMLLGVLGELAAWRYVWRRGRERRSRIWTRLRKARQADHHIDLLDLETSQESVATNPPVKQVRLEDLRRPDGAWWEPGDQLPRQKSP